MIIKIITLALMAIFYICYFGKVISQRKQGIKTDQLGKGKEGFVKFIEIALKISTYILPVIQIISIILCPVSSYKALKIAGVVINALGVFIFILIFFIFVFSSLLFRLCSIAKSLNKTILS